MADQNKQRNYKSPPIKFSNLFLWFHQTTDPKEDKRLQIRLTVPASSLIRIRELENEKVYFYNHISAVMSAMLSCPGRK